MEFIDGPSLDELIEDRERLDEQDILNIGIDVTKGLQAAHDKDLIHGDIKPENIMIDRDFRAKVVDFGLVYAANEVQAGIRFGSPFYISPESIERKPEDFRSDLYSLGATLFHALTGEPMFTGDNVETVLQSQLDDKIPDLKKLRPEVSGPTIAIINQLLEKDPDDRYLNHETLLDDFKEAIVQSKDSF